METSAVIVTRQSSHKDGTWYILGAYESRQKAEEATVDFCKRFCEFDFLTDFKYTYITVTSGGGITINWIG